MFPVMYNPSTANVATLAVPDTDTNTLLLDNTRMPELPEDTLPVFVTFCWNVRAVVPTTIGLFVASTHCVSAYMVPSVTIKIMPASISPVALASVDRVQVPFDPVPGVVTT